MKPVLFEKDATEFSSLGLCRLPDAIACTVTEERNGAFELELIYPTDGHYAEELREDRIIAVIPRDGATKKQGFRIYRILTEMPGQLTVSARHISYQLTNIPVPVNAGVSDSAEAAMRLLKNWAEEPCPFSFYSDIVGASRSYGISTPTSLRSALGGVQGSILDAYGGELEWDNWDIHLWAARGADHGVRITYGKNLTALSRAVDIGETITGVMGFWQGQNDDGTRALIYTNPRVISNPQAGEYSYPRTMVLDATGAFESPPTVAQLTSYVTSYLTASTLAAVDEAIDVDFIALWQTPEYRDYAPLERVSLCDTVYVGYKQMGVSIKKKVTRVVYNVLAGRYDSIQLGSASTVADTIAAIGSETAGKYSKPAGGIPASDLAPGVIPKKTSELDNDSGLVEQERAALTFTIAEAADVQIHFAARTGDLITLAFLCLLDTTTIGWHTLFTFTNITVGAYTTGVMLDSAGRPFMVRVNTDNTVSVYQYTTNNPVNVRGEITFILTGVSE